MFRNVELLAISLLFCVGSGREPLCSRYHYEEQILAKVLRLEHRMDMYDETKVSVLTQCPDSWVSFKNSCYLFVDEKATHQNAKLHCLMHGAHLVHVNDEEESAFLSLYLRKFKGQYYVMKFVCTYKL
ncbi:C-type lectin domain family 4 member E-like [Ruditapes philippinarum]|uniref:C-type lectin domain family 4 member E-like n=1 Tax=Ruditapes philippinarum TaxID=129788 RepID=UPI00295BF9B3|nr:C-type lectin domain family 4 member E-like [Ruditapes philippinarum]